VDILEGYYANPEKLKAISENGCRKIKRLYSYESQILPRINILKEQIEQAAKNKKSILATLGPKKIPSPKERMVQSCFSILVGLKRACPRWIKSLMMNGLVILHSNPKLYRSIRNIPPESFLSFYYRVRDAKTYRR
jgi:hypothetical protein